MELIQLSLEDITPQEEANDPCENCTTLAGVFCFFLRSDVLKA